MRGISTVIVLVIALLALPACEQLNPIEKQQYENLMFQNAPPIKEKSPWVAGSLNLFPGFGDIYTGHWGAFALDFLFWPISIVWAIPQGAVTAGQHNKKATIAFYSVGMGQGRFDPNRAPGASNMPPPSGASPTP